jgi:hypothetical protein
MTTPNNPVSLYSAISALVAKHQNALDIQYKDQGYKVDEIGITVHVRSVNKDGKFAIHTLQAPPIFKFGTPDEVVGTPVNLQ